MKDKRALTPKNFGVTLPSQGGFTPSPKPLVGGFTLVLSILVSSLLLLAGVTIVNLTVKELQLSSAARESLVAFQSADSLLECVLSLDMKEPSPFGGVIRDIRGESMEGYWRFDDVGNEVAIDLSGKGNDIPVFSNEIDWVDWGDGDFPDSNGVLNNRSALSFPGGSNDNSSISRNDFEVSSLNGLTIAFWAYLEGSTNGAFVRLGDDDNNSLVVGIGHHDRGINELGYNFWIGFNEVFQNPNNVSFQPGWNHVTVFVNPDGYYGYRIFRLGSSSFHSPNSGPVPLTSYTGLDVGGYTHEGEIEDPESPFGGVIPWDFPRYVEAVIDDLRIYSRALSDEEIGNLPKIGRELSPPLTAGDGETSCLGIDLVSELTGWDPVESPTQTSVRFTFDAPEQAVYGQAHIIKQLDNTNIYIRGYNNDSDSSRRYERGLEARIDPVRHQDIPQPNSLFVNMYILDNDTGEPPADNQIKVDTEFTVGWNIIGNPSEIQCSHLGPLASVYGYQPDPFSDTGVVNDVEIAVSDTYIFTISCINTANSLVTQTSVSVEIVD